MTRRVICAEEGSSEWHLHADMIKLMTSGGKIEARGMRSNSFVERSPMFTPFIATNDYPEIRFADMATKRRLIAFPFHQKVNPRLDDSQFRTRLGPADLAAVLRWLLDGYAAYCERKLEGRPPDVRDAVDDLSGTISPFDQFISECCKIDPKLYVPARDLYSGFSRWWADEGRRDSERPTQTSFGRAMTDRDFPSGVNPERLPGIREKIIYRHGFDLRPNGSQYDTPRKWEGSAVTSPTLPGREGLELLGIVGKLNGSHQFPQVKVYILYSWEGWEPIFDIILRVT
jgi:putative DNA primase/helicase